MFHCDLDKEGIEQGQSISHSNIICRKSPLQGKPHDERVARYIQFMPKNAMPYYLLGLWERRHTQMVEDLMFSMSKEFQVIESSILGGIGTSPSLLRNRTISRWKLLGRDHCMFCRTSLKVTVRDSPKLDSIMWLGLIDSPCQPWIELEGSMISTSYIIFDELQSIRT